jgi:hypothetical protein
MAKQSHDRVFNKILKISVKKIEECPVDGLGYQWYADLGTPEWNASLEEMMIAFKQHVCFLGT